MSYCNESERQENHANHGENADVVSLIDGTSAFFNGASAEELVTQVFNLLAGAFVSLEYLGEFVDSLVEITTEQAHGVGVGDAFGGRWGGMWPEDAVGAVPEFVGEVVVVGGYHGFDSGVDDGERVVGPEISANVGEVFVFEEELVAQTAVKHEAGLGLLVRLCAW